MKSSNHKSFLQEPEIAVPVLTKISLHGTVLLQKLLQFGNPRLITTSLLDMKGVSLKNLACNRHGSFVYDALVTSRTVGEKTRENLVSKMKVSSNITNKNAFQSNANHPLADSIGPHKIGRDVDIFL